MASLKYFGLFLVLCVVVLTSEASPQFFGGGFRGGFRRSFQRPTFVRPSFGGFGGGFNRFHRGGFGGFGGFSREGFGGNSFEFFG